MALGSDEFYKSFVFVFPLGIIVWIIAHNIIKRYYVRNKRFGVVYDMRNDFGGWAVGVCFIVISCILVRLGII